MMTTLAILRSSLRTTRCSPYAGMLAQHKQISWSCQKQGMPSVRTISTSQRLLRTHEHVHQTEPPAPLPQSTPFVQQTVPQHETWRPPRIFGAFVYFIVVGAVTYNIAAYTTVNDTITTANEISKNETPLGNYLSYVGDAFNTGNSSGASIKTSSGRVSEEQLWSARQHRQARKLGNVLRRVMSACDALHIGKQAKQRIAKTYLRYAQKYIELPHPQAVLLPVFALNAAIFLTLNVGRLISMRTFDPRTFDKIIRLFAHTPGLNRKFTMTTSVFAHVGIAHIAFNTMAIWSFNAKSLDSMRFLSDDHGHILHTAEVSLFPHFLAFFIVSGTFASLCSQVYSKIMFAIVQRRAGYAIAMAQVGKVPGLGSSGAAYAMVALSAFSFRDESRIYILHPSLGGKPLEVLKVLVSVESILMIASLLLAKRISPIDHSAHMGGALFGYFYYKYGNVLWERRKQDWYEIFQKRTDEKRRTVELSNLDSPKATRAEPIQLHQNRSSPRLV